MKGAFMSKLHTMVVFALWLTTVSSMSAMEQESVSMRKNEQKSAIQKIADLYEEIKGLARAADVATVLARYRARIPESNLPEAARLLHKDTYEFYAACAASLEARKILLKVALLCEQKSNNASDAQERRLFLYEAVRIFRSLADEGYVDAQTALGSLLLAKSNDGSHEERAYTLDIAEGWLRKAAEQGSMVAQNNLGALCEKKALASRDVDGKKALLDEAKAWYLKAAERGLANAQINMGAFYFKQYNVAPGADRSDILLKAEEWFHKAANRGDPHGQNKLGLLYVFRYEKSDDETEKEKFYAEAINWFNKSAQQNFAEATDNRAALYQSALKRYLKMINKDAKAESLGIESSVVRPEDLNGYAQKGVEAAKAYILSYVGNADTMRDCRDFEVGMAQEPFHLERILEVTSPKMLLHQKALRELVAYSQAQYDTYKNKEVISGLINRSFTRAELDSLFVVFATIAESIYIRVLQPKNYAEMAARKIQSVRQLKRLRNQHSVERPEQVSLEVYEKFAKLQLPVEEETIDKVALQEEIASDIERLRAQKIALSDEFLIPDIFFQRGLESGRTITKRLTLLAQGLFLEFNAVMGARLTRLDVNPYDAKEFSKIKKYFAGILRVLEQFDISSLLQQCEESQAIKIRQEYNFGLRMAQIIWYIKFWEEGNVILGKLLAYRGDIISYL